MVPSVEGGSKHDSIDLMLTGNVSARKRKLEDWARRKEKERCKSILENIRKDKAPGKSKQKKVCRNISIEYKIRFYKDEGGKV